MTIGFVSLFILTGKERDDLEVKEWSCKNPKNRLTTFLLLVL
jgi:hypothetical protein